MTYMKCSCGNDTFIRTEKTAIVKIKQTDDGDVDEEIDSLLNPEFEYACQKCGNTDL